MMVHLGDADGLVSGLTKPYPETVRPALQIVGMRPDVTTVAGLYVLVLKEKIVFIADGTVNIEPKVAMLSFSNFGSTRHPLADKVRRATEIVKERMPDLIIDGEMQADTALVPEIIEETYPFSALNGKGSANVLIFPNLESGNMANKLLQRLGAAESIGPILLGINKPIHVLQIGDFDETDVVSMTAIAGIHAQVLEHEKRGS